MTDYDNLGQPPVDAVDDIPDTDIAPGLEPIGDETPLDTPVENIPGESTEPAPEEPIDINWRERAAQDQTRYQNALTALRPYVTPEEYSAIKANANAMTKAQYGQPEAPQPEQPESLYDMTPAQVQAMIRDTVQSEYSNNARQLEIDRQVNKELAAANAEYVNFVKDGRFTDAEINEAAAAVKEFGFDMNKPGGAARTAKAMIGHLHMMNLQKGYQKKTDESAETAADKARRLALTTQPAASAAAPSVEEQSYQRQVLEQTKALRRNSLEDLRDK